MTKVKCMKYIALASVVAAISGSPALASTSCPGQVAWGPGRVTSVIQDSTSFISQANQLIGIEISYDLTTNKQYFFTYMYADVGSADKARTLLQLANLAYTTQAPVVASTNSNCTDTSTLDGKTWIKQWQGLIIGNAAKP